MNDAIERGIECCKKEMEPCSPSVPAYQINWYIANALEAMKNPEGFTSAEAKGMVEPKRYKCNLCGRDRFDRAYQPHMCNNQFRKRGFKLEEVKPDWESLQDEGCPLYDAEKGCMADKLDKLVPDMDGDGRLDLDPIEKFYDKWCGIDLVTPKDKKKFISESWEAIVKYNEEG